MNFLSRSASRSLCSFIQNSKPCIGAVGSSLQSHYIMQPSTRSFVMLSSSSLMNQNKYMKSSLCTSGTNNGMHTKGDKELVEFLQNEIAMEKQNLSQVSVTLDDFSVTQDEAVLVLKKNYQDEQITITLNVNHTVTASDSPQGEDRGNELLSRPDFEVDIKVGSKTLSLTCQFSAPSDITEGDHVEDDFGISEVTMYEGEWQEKTYCVSGDILDEVMYDMFMNMLEERGITNEFAQRLSRSSTDYEHTLFVTLLENIQKFISRK